MSDTPSEINAAIISANLVALHARLKLGLAMTTAASRAMTEDNQNLAMGSIIDLERIIPECDALYRTILLLHRSRDMVVAEGGVA
ncbi:MAG: hypothetical protein EKK41_12800 [Hyphomicrobiales bacterium]|nr:MAG: hypothetical protein EKK41_12800 [Hyphomicrobiales bacterium]